MKTYTRYCDVPKDAMFLGSENGDGTIYEELAQAIEDAIAPVQLIDDTGVSYFDLSGFDRA